MALVVTTTASGNSALAAASATTEAQQSGGDPSLNSKAALPNTAAALQASKDGTNASIQLADGFGTQSLQWFIAAKAATPITAQTQTATLANLDGLTNASTAQVSLSPVFWRPRSPDPIAAQAVCDNYHIDPCTRLGLPDDKAKEEFDRASEVSYGVPLFGTVALQLGYQQFKYLSASTFAAQKEAHTPIGFNASFGALFPGWGYVGATYRYQTAFNAADSKSVCTQTSVAGTTTCTMQSVGAPTSTTSDIVGLEVRWFAKQVAVNPGVSYDVKNDVWGVQIPIYFIVSAGGALIGGINPGWRSDTKEVAATFFVGAALDVAPGLPSFAAPPAAKAPAAPQSLPAALTPTPTAPSSPPTPPDPPTTAPPP